MRLSRHGLPGPRLDAPSGNAATYDFKLLDCIIIRSYSNCMPRPSRNIDQLLIDTARELLPETGARGFSIRQLTERAGVNLGMFHYHFKTRENFLSIVLQSVYEEMFTQLTFQAHGERPPLENLRAAVNVLGRFLRDNRHLLRRLMPDAIAGEPIARKFFHTNFPRHLAVMAQLVGEAQRIGAAVSSDVFYRRRRGDADHDGERGAGGRLHSTLIERRPRRRRAQ
jgi:AcrR family transcriptional regulator